MSSAMGGRARNTGHTSLSNVATHRRLDPARVRRARFALGLGLALAPGCSGRPIEVVPDVEVLDAPGAEVGPPDAPPLDAASDATAPDAPALDASDAAAPDAVDAPLEAAPDALAPSLTLRAPGFACLPVGLTRTLRVGAEFNGATGPVRIALVGLPEDGSIEAGTANVTASGGASQSLALRLVRMPATSGARLTVRLRGTPAMGLAAEVPLMLQLGRCPGTFDERFNASGEQPGALQLETPMGLAAEPFLLSMDASDRIIVAAPISEGSPWWQTFTSDFGVWRVTGAGLLDPAFNPGGTIPGFLLMDLARPAYPHSDVPIALRVDATGIDVLANTVVSNMSPREKLGLVRVTNGGVLDRTFGTLGTDGTRSGSLFIGPSQPNSTRDRIVAAYSEPDGSRIFVGAVRAPDELETPFVMYTSVDGTVSRVRTIDVLRGGVLEAAVRTTDGVMLAGTAPASSSTGVFLARYSLSAMALDASFGTAGVAGVHVTQVVTGRAFPDQFGGLTATPTGFVVGGATGTGSSDSQLAFLANFGPNGALLPWSDSTTAVRTYRCSADVSTSSVFSSITRDTAGNLLAAGRCRRASFDAPMVAAMRADGTLIEDFGDGSQPGFFVWDFADPVGRPALLGFAWRVVTDAAGSVVVSAQRTMRARYWDPYVLRLHGVPRD